MIRPSRSSSQKCSQVAQRGTSRLFASSTRGAYSWVRKMPTAFPDWTSNVSSSLSRRRAAGLFPRAAIDDEVFRALGDLGVEVVAEHAQRRLLMPASGTELGAAGGADGRGDQWGPTLPSPASGGGEILAAILASLPLRTSSIAAWISGSSTRSWSRVGTFSR